MSKIQQSLETALLEAILTKLETQFNDKLDSFSDDIGKKLTELKKEIDAVTADPFEKKLTSFTTELDAKIDKIQTLPTEDFARKIDAFNTDFGTKIADLQSKINAIQTVSTAPLEEKINGFNEQLDQKIINLKSTWITTNPPTPVFGTTLKDLEKKQTGLMCQIYGLLTLLFLPLIFLGYKIIEIPTNQEPITIISGAIIAVVCLISVLWYMWHLNKLRYNLSKKHMAISTFSAIHSLLKDTRDTNFEYRSALKRLLETINDLAENEKI